MRGWRQARGQHAPRLVEHHPDRPLIGVQYPGQLVFRTRHELSRLHALQQRFPIPVSRSVRPRKVKFDRTECLALVHGYQNCRTPCGLQPRRIQPTARGHYLGHSPAQRRHLGRLRRREAQGLALGGRQKPHGRTRNANPRRIRFASPRHHQRVIVENRQGEPLLVAHQHRGLTDEGASPIAALNHT